MNRDLISALRKDTYQGDISNQQSQATQIVVDEEFDFQINRLQGILDAAKLNIKKIKQLGNELRTNVNISKARETNSLLDRLNLDVSNSLRDVGNQLLALSTQTKNRPQDKNTPIRVSFQRKLAKDLKSTLTEFNKIKEENHKEAYKMFKHQYRITNNRATESEIKKAFEENNNEPVFIRELSSTQLSKRAHQEAQDRNVEMKKIEQSIEELLNTFQDMQTMLVTQNEAIISIEDTVDQAQNAVEQGSEEMTKAIETRKKSRKLLWIITIIVLILLIILFVFLWNNVIGPAVNTAKDTVNTIKDVVD